MKRLIGTATVTAMAVALAASAHAATWTKVGIASTASNNAKYQDDQRQIPCSVVADGVGNIYATNNQAGSLGFITVFKAGGGQVEVNLQTAGYPGAVTKLVAAGDKSLGRVYALQNYCEVGFGGTSDLFSRILRIKSDGTVSLVYCPKNLTLSDPNNPNSALLYPNYLNMSAAKIQGMAVNYDTGELCFLVHGFGGVGTAGDSNYWKYRNFYKYEPVTSTGPEGRPVCFLEECKVTGNEEHRFFNLEYVGHDQFAHVRGGTSAWGVNAFTWADGGWVGNVTNADTNPGFRTHVTQTAYDAVGEKLWVVGIGIGGALAPLTAQQGGSTVASRWNGDIQTPTFFDGTSAGYSLPTITGNPGGNANAWHVNGNNPQSTLVPNFNGYVNRNSSVPEGDPLYVAGKERSPRYWVSALAISPEGRAWMGYAASASYVMPDIGHVMIRGGNHTEQASQTWDVLHYYDGGLVQENSYVVGLTFDGATAYALVVSRTDNKYSLYKTTETTLPGTPPVSIGSMKTGPAIGLELQTDVNKVVTLVNQTGGYFYAEDKSRAAGVKVVPQDSIAGVLTTMAVGNEVSFHGFSALKDGEVRIGADNVSVAAGTALVPVYVRGAYLGGKVTGLQPAVKPGLGLSNIGLHVRTSGKVTAYGLDVLNNPTMRIDDGSGGIFGLNPTDPGVLVHYDLSDPPTANIGDMVSVQGVVAVLANGDAANTLEPVIDVRSGADIVTINP